MGRLIITIALLIIGIIIFVSPVRGTLDTFDPVESRIADLNEALDNAGKIQLRRAELEADYNSLRAEDITRLHKLLPSHVDNVRLIIEINDIAKDNNIVVTNIDIGGTSEDKEDDENITVTPVNTLFERLTLSISAVGEYEAFKKFLDELGKSLRMVDVLELSFNSRVDGSFQVAGNPDLSDVYTYNVALQTYWLKENQNE